MLANLGLLILLCVVMAVTFQRYPKFSLGALATGILAISGMSIKNLNTIHTKVEPLKAQAAANLADMPSFNLSKNGQNVVVFMITVGMRTYNVFQIGNAFLY